MLIDNTLANKALALLAARAVRSHPPRSQERRTAAGVYAALVTTTTAGQARRALPGIAGKGQAREALALLARIEQEAR